MRKITQAMVNAVENGKTWTEANTTVNVIDGKASVYLHGNLIAVVENTQMKICLCGWNTPTTRARLSGLVQRFSKVHTGVSSIKGEPHVVGVVPSENIKMDTRQWYTLAR